MKKTIKVISLGCKVNSYESSLIMNSFLLNGYKEDINDPSVIIINTCSVTQTADQKSRQHIRKMKTDFPNALIVVMGCYSQKQGEFISKDIDVPIVIGTSSRNKIYEYVNQYLKDKKKILDLSNPRLYKCYEELGVEPYFENVRAYLKIQDGCDNFCSYCLIPFVRGKARSRNKEEILKEARNIILKGYKEIILAGIHVGGYGLDFNNDYTFSSLIDDLTKLDGLERLTISSIEASEIDDKLIELIKTRKNISRHLHIPLQSGSEKILTLMNRKYTKKEFLDKISKIRKEVPDIMIASDVIVGFPFESDEDFKECFDFINQCGFNMLHVFPYSQREGTKASRMDHQIDPKIKKERARILIELSNKLFSEYKKKFINKELDFLIESYNKETDLIKGLSSNYISYEFKGEISDIGKIIKTSYKIDK